MSILIKGMKMPPSDKALIMAYKDGRFIWIDLESEKTYQYEAMEVPTPHGRLIDADALLMDANKLRYGEGWLITVENIEAAPTVIEAEENEND